MKTTKILFALIAMLLCSTSGLAHDFEVDGIYYNITSEENLTVAVTFKGETITDFSDEYTGSVYIPETVTYNSIIYNVTSIGEDAFSRCFGLTSVTIGNSVTSIGDEAFYNCSGLTSVTIPNSVTSIGSRAFEYCFGLTSVSIPNNITSIEEYTFSGCSGLTSVTIPNSVTSIGDKAFFRCSGLTSVTIGNSVTSIGSSAFSGCEGLTSVSIPNSVTSIGDEAFYNCSGLTSVTIPNSVTSIGDEAFYNCSGLTSVTIPNSVTSIGSFAFYDCYGLTSVSIPNNVTSIEYYTFCGCSGLTSVTIPNSVTSIGIGAFFGSGLTSVTIPNSVTSIGGYAFEECPNLTEATVGCKWKENPVYTFDSNVTVNATLHSYTDGICTECEHPNPSSPAVIIDGAVTEYSVAVESACPITYTRTFNNTEWQALYVPFAMSYDDWKEDFDVAKINDIHQFDVNNDGDFDDAEDKTIMEMLKVNSGTLKANHPYMIRAKSTGEKSITIENATLMPTEVNSIDCSSVERKYVFTGTYNTIDGETMVNNKYYAMSGGG